MKRASLNHCYRLIWSDLHQSFIAVAEIARARGKRTCSAVLLSTLCLPALAADLPEGGRIVAGSGAIASTGTTMTVTQTSERLAADWQSFGIGAGHAVHFVQPSASSVALNRVLGSDVSVIQGQLSANGQVFLINPNGVLFTPTAQVDVGGLVASTRNISNEDFLAGRYRFSGDSDAAVRNEGQVKVGAGGTAAFIAARIENTGSIEAPRGNVLMGAGSTVTLDLGEPVKIQVEEGALNALIEQGGAIRADGGLVYLSARAAGDLASAAINHSGITEAKTLATGEKGEIYLLGDPAAGTVNVSGRLDASGGFVETSAARVKVADGAQVSAGNWLIDPTDYTIAASGGDISGATLSANLATTDVTIQTSAAGSGNGDIFVRDNVSWNSGNTLTLSAHRNIEILATLDATGGAGGKVALEYGQGAVASGNTSTYGFGLTGSGFTGRIDLQAGPNFSTKLGSDGTPIDYTVITSLGAEGSTSGADLQGMAGNVSGNYALGADIDASSTALWNDGAGFAPPNSPNGFSGRLDGLGHVISDLTINRPSTDDVGLISTMSVGASVRHLGLRDVNVLGRSSVGGLAGFTVQSIFSQNYVTGTVSATSQVGALVGVNAGGTIDGSYATADVTGGNGNTTGGLVGNNSGGTISQSYATGTVSGYNNVGGLVGLHQNGTISQSYATGNVSGASVAGGLVGLNIQGTISQSYATGNVSGQLRVGGLLGAGQNGTVTHSYATGSVSGTSLVGGLVGHNLNQTIFQSYAIGSVPASGTNVGGLVGRNDGGNVTASFWDTQTTGQATSAGGTAKTTAEMKSLPTFLGWDINDQGGTGIWRIYEGSSYPLLRSFLTPLSITSATPGSKIYDGLSVSSSELSDLFAFSGTPDATKLLLGGTVTNQKNAGSYTAAVYSTQDGYDLIGDQSVAYTITPKELTANYTAANKTYDGSTAASISAASSDLIAGDVVTITASGVFDNKNAGTGKTVAISDGELSGADAGNYVLQNASGSTTADITPKALTANYTAANKTYDGSTAASISATSSDFIAGDVVTITASGVFDNKNAGTDKTVAISDGELSGADARNYVLKNASGSTTADITPKELTANYTAANKTYDGSTAASISATTSDLIAGDAVSITASGVFDNKNAGTDKTVAISDGELSGADAGNYVLQNASGSTTADITPKALTADYTAANKTYDGSTAASISATISDLIAGDVVTITASGAFDTKNAGTDKTVAISDGELSGADARNYVLKNASGSTTADITPKALTAGYTAANKTYDGSTAASISATTSDLIAGDVVTITASGVFDNKNAGTDKTVAISDGELSGADAANYVLKNASGSTTADIAARPVTVTADTQSKAEGQPDPALTYSTGCAAGQSTDCGLVAGETLSGNLARDAGEAVGHYAIRQGTVDDAHNPNYLITYVGGDLTIAAANAGGGSTGTESPANTAIAIAQTNAAGVGAASNNGTIGLGRAASVGTATANVGSGAQPVGVGGAPLQTSGGLVLVEMRTPQATDSGTAVVATNTPPQAPQAGVDSLGFVRVVVIDGGIKLDQRDGN